MLGQRLDAERLRRVMAPVKHIQAEILSHPIGPMRPFAGDKRVHPLVGCLLQITSRPTAHDADSTANRRTPGYQQRFRLGSALQTPSQVGT